MYPIRSNQKSNMTNYCSQLHAECPTMQKYLSFCADRGMGFLLSAAGGEKNWTVEDPVRQSAAAFLLQGMNSTTSYTIPKLNEMEQTATRNLVAKVLLHMKYEHHKTV